MWLRTVIALGHFVLAAGISSAAPDEAERLVEFRDGSVLRLSLPSDYKFEFREAVLDLAGEPEPEPKPLPIDAPTSIRFSILPAFKQLRTIQDAITQLNAENFADRENALRTLVGGGTGFRPFIEDMFKEITLPETRSRLAKALEVIPEQPGLHEHSYDEVVESGKTSKGDIGDWKLTANYRSTPIQLDRKSVRTIRNVPAAGKPGNAPVVATTEPIRKDLDLLFPKDCVRIDFETDSKGDPLRPGQNISRRFVRDGLLIDTSIDGSFFSVNDFAVSSRSAEQSGATHDPLFKGVITLTFCVPGNEHELAGVTHIGLYAAVVQEGGTTLAAFDASGHRIASVTTESGPHEFFGLRSNVPIHQVQIIPNVGIDDNVTIDDIVFSVPETLDAGGADNDLCLDFASGERLVCDDFKIVDNNITATPTGGFAPELTFPLSDLRQLRTPMEGQDLIPQEKLENVRFWLLLKDGSTLLGRAGNDDSAARTLLEGFPLTTLEISAIWSEDGELAPLPSDTELEAGQIASIAKAMPTIYDNPTFKADMLTAAANDAEVEFLYNRLPTIWFEKPDDQAIKKATGFVRLNTGERLLLGDGMAFQLESFDSKSIRLKMGEKDIQLPLESVTTLRLPTSQ